MRLPRSRSSSSYAELQRVVTENIGNGIVKIDLLARKHIPAGRRLQPLRRCGHPVGN